MVFLDIKNKIWKVRELEIPVIEDVPMKEMKWFREKIKVVSKLEKDGTISQDESLEVDDEWWGKVCKIGLNKTVDEVLESGCTEPEFRELMAEVYGFLANFGTIERAKQYALYDPKILEKEKKQKENILNSKN